MIYIAELKLEGDLKKQLGEKIDICVDNFSPNYKAMEEDLGDNFFIDFMKHYFEVEKEDFYVDNKRNPRYRREMDLEEFSIAVQENHRELRILNHNNVTVYYEKSSQR